LKNNQIGNGLRARAALVAALTRTMHKLKDGGLVKE
jgi:hypothetical protein